MAMPQNTVGVPSPVAAEFNVKEKSDEDNPRASSDTASTDSSLLQIEGPIINHDLFQKSRGPVISPLNGLIMQQYGPRVRFSTSVHGVPDAVYWSSKQDDTIIPLAILRFTDSSHMDVRAERMAMLNTTKINMQISVSKHEPRKHFTDATTPPSKGLFDSEGNEYLHKCVFMGDHNESVIYNIRSSETITGVFPSPLPGILDEDLIPESAVWYFREPNREIKMVAIIQHGEVGAIEPKDWGMKTDGTPADGSEILVRSAPAMREAMLDIGAKCKCDYVALFDYRCMVLVTRDEDGDSDVMTISVGDAIRLRCLKWLLDACQASIVRDRDVTTMELLENGSSR
ncbi:hypothetical protein T440DRAFT_482393 [Plenodomus tracheiphilus IPT5]|uniref:Uncharacterized protein n=1 Tax=Plenodomus tracheiphilus IPT5 TaxID=1408161 RepID=A0A6A7AWT5_9PLEO|nr:hypothetical protein T440DRAFT_482393 [Plenodomus tracheiphilus IPT5]